MLSINRGEPERFAVYAGDGQYVTAHKHAEGKLRGRTITTADFVRLGDAGQALALERSKAIEVTHGARRAGVPAWIVRHPAGVAA